MDADQLTPELAKDAPRHSMQRLVVHLDLFSGIGGFALAAQMVGGIKTAAFCEIDPWARQVLAKNFPNVPIHDDVRTLNPNEYGTIDLITGGYPCQPFSYAGKRKGEDDDRHLWPAMVEVIAKARPRWVLAENVAGHVTMGLDEVLSDLDSIGYAAEATVVPACAVDARHRRDRVWIMAYRTQFGSDGGKRGQHQAAGQIQRETGRSGSTLADSASKQTSWQGSSGLLSELAQCCRWEPEPAVGRVVDGLPGRLDRLRGLGNAIVPQVAAEILRCMMRVDSLHNAPTLARAGGRRNHRPAAYGPLPALGLFAPLTQDSEDESSPTARGQE